MLGTNGALEHSFSLPPCHAIISTLAVAAPCWEFKQSARLSSPRIPNWKEGRTTQAHSASGFTTILFFFSSSNPHLESQSKNGRTKNARCFMSLLTSFQVVNNKGVNLLITKANICVDILPIPISYMSACAIRLVRARLCHVSLCQLYIVRCLEQTLTKSCWVNQWFSFLNLLVKELRGEYFTQVKQWLTSLAGARSATFWHNIWLFTYLP